MFFNQLVITLTKTIDILSTVNPIKNRPYNEKPLTLPLCGSIPIMPHIVSSS